ncbi:MAG: hypothetical protein IIC73_01820, partial [Armatimonadetes bacterium]|nr:hypothetical protein [Armatimonadota bacterium]
VARMFGGEGAGIGGKSRQAARQAATLSNAKQVAIATIIYVTDYDGRYPLGMASQREFERALMPYARNSSTFRSLNPAGGMLDPNSNLAAVPEEGVMDIAATALLFETYDWPDGRRVVAFADSHAKFIEGFDVSTDLEVELDEEAQRTMDELALELERSASAPAAARPLGMPGG